MPKKVKSGSALRIGAAAAILLALAAGGDLGCASMPEPKFDKYEFPKKHVHVENVTRPRKIIGEVKSRVDFTSLDPMRDEKVLCNNYYNKAAKDLLKFAQEKGADAVIEVRSIVFLEDGRVEAYKTPECSDDGSEGQILLRGLAVKWLPREAGAAGATGGATGVEGADSDDSSSPVKVSDLPNAPAPKPTPVEFQAPSKPEPKPTEVSPRPDLAIPQPQTQWE